jgi:glycine cleavage system aminomethyltransferase T
MLQVVGNTTSGCFSVTLQQPLAFAYVDLALATPGTSLEVELLGQRCEAKVLDGPPMEIEARRK